MKPGDLIEWVYKMTQEVVDPHELLFSTTMNKLILIGGVHLLIGRDDGVLTFLTVGSDKGLLHAREDDTWDGYQNVASVTEVAPRARG